MHDDFPFLEDRQWLLFSNEDNPDRDDLFSPLAYEDSFLRYLPEVNDGTKHYGTLHLYPAQRDPLVYLGGKDRRLPEYEEAVQYLNDQGYFGIERPHGGLAVVNDSGIVNLSLAVDTEAPLSIDTAYEQLVHLLRVLFSKYDLTLESYEIEQSYCPGKFDLVINGKKVGGTAQRRFRNGVAVAAYLSLSGNQTRRAEMIRTFYDIGQADDQYPEVDPRVMTTLSDILGMPYTVEAFEEDLFKVFAEYTTLTKGNYKDPVLASIYDRQYQQLLNRNHRFGNLNALLIAQQQAGDENDW